MIFHSQTDGEKRREDEQVLVNNHHAERVLAETTFGLERAHQGCLKAFQDVTLHETIGKRHAKRGIGEN